MKPLHKTLRFARRPVVMTAWGLGLMAGIIAGCMTSVGLPPQFRFSCASDDDCQVITDENGDTMYEEKCISGLCQYPCNGTILTNISGECPAEKEFFGCFNGVCSHLCDNVTELCRHPQVCVVQDIEIPPEFADQIPGGIDLEQTGICGIRCDAEGAPPCPNEQICLEGVCLGFGTNSGTNSDTTDSSGGAP